MCTKSQSYWNPPFTCCTGDHALVFHSYLLRCQRGPPTSPQVRPLRGFLWHLPRPKVRLHNFFRRLGMVHTCAGDVSPFRNHPFWECSIQREIWKLRSWGAPIFSRLKTWPQRAQGRFGGSMQEPASGWLFFEKAKVCQGHVDPKLLSKTCPKRHGCKKKR